MATDDGVDRIICLTGPESTGKSTLAAVLGERFEARVVPEVAREYLASRSTYGPDDLLAIARLQSVREHRARTEHRGLLICDTDLLVIQIWYREKFAAVPEFVTRELSRRSSRGYLLLAPDLPWEPDPLRENPDDRDRLFELHRAELDASPFPHRIVRGRGAARERCASEMLQQLLAEL